MAALKVESPQHPGDWPRHRLTCDTPLGFMIMGVDPTSPRASAKEKAQVFFCRTLYQTREPSIHCTRDPFPLASFAFSLSLLVETLSMEFCLLGLFLSLCLCPCPGPWFCSSCLASSGFLSLALVHVLALARCLSPWLCLCFFVVFSYSFLSILYCAPGPRQEIARFTVLCLRSLALFFLHPLLLVRPVYP